MSIFNYFSGLLRPQTLTEPGNLEQQFAEEAFSCVDVRNDCGFQDFLQPNEWEPEEIKAHLDLAGRGIIVSTGTERSFFNLLFSDKERCRGLLIRDINPRVKAYVDFNTLLLRISNSRQEYCDLSALLDVNDPAALKGRILDITSKITEGSLPDRIRFYYLQHLDDFAFIYFKTGLTWRNDPNQSKFFKKCRYDLDDGLFSKLQQYALEGSIVAITGSINDLRSISSKSVIAAVDVSNISDYVFIDLQLDSNPRVIHSTGTFFRTNYHSHRHIPFTHSQRIEFATVLERIKKCYGPKFNSILIRKLLNKLNSAEIDPFDDHRWAVYSPATLSLLKEYTETYIIEIPGLEPMDMRDHPTVEYRLNHATESQLKEFCSNRKAIPYVGVLVRSWPNLKPAAYLALSNLPGWSDKIEEYFSDKSYELPCFLKNLEEANLLTQFTNLFGSERLAKLKR